MRKLAFVVAIGFFALMLLVCAAGRGVAQRWDSVSLTSREGNSGSFFASETISSTVFQQGLYPEPSYSGVTDTYIWQDRTDENFGSSTSLTLYYDGRQRILLRFDLSSYIPVNAVVTGARLELYAYYAQNAGVATYVDLYEVLRPWEELQATWRRATSSQRWEIDGCNGPTDRALQRTAQALFRNVNAWQIWENEPLRDLVQRWVSNPTVNHGVILVGSSPYDRQFWYLRSSQFDAKSYRPKLTVWYYVPTATPTPTLSPTPSRTATYTPTPTPVITVGAVSGTAWHDANGNRIRDPHELPFPGVTVVLKDADHVEIARQTTLEDGSYRFTDLPSGSYLLTKEDPAGYMCTYPMSGAYAFYLAAGQQLSGLDFGFSSWPTATPTPTAMPTMTSTPTSTPTPTKTLTATPTNTPTGMATQTPTATPTVTMTPSPVGTPSGTIYDPIPIVCEGVYPGSTVGRAALIQNYGACGTGVFGPEVVYVFQATHFINYLSLSLDSEADLALFVLPGTNSQECLPPSGGSIVLSNVAQGTVYYIVVDGYEAGSYTLALHCYPPPSYTATPIPTPTLTPTSGPSPTRTLTPPLQGPSTIYLPLVQKPRLEILVDCGARDPYLDSQGRLWAADKAYTPGSWGYVGESEPFSTVRSIGNTSDPALYQTLRWGLVAFGYQFDVSNGNYEVELHFAEVYRTGVGTRKFDVIIEGQTVLHEYDVTAMAGGKYLARVETFVVVVRDGQLNVDFVRGSVDYPMINALRVTKR